MFKCWKIGRRLTLLDEHVVPRLKSEEVHAKLTGTTSKSGEAEYNRQLSLGRVLRVKEYLRSKGIPESKIPGPEIRAAGEDLSKSTSNEDEVDRAVQIVIVTGIKPLTWNEFETAPGTTFDDLDGLQLGPRVLWQLAPRYLWVQTD